MTDNVIYTSALNNKESEPEIIPEDHKEGGNTVTQEEIEEEELEPTDYMLKAPFIPEEIYRVLPKVLKDGAQLFNTPREKDVFLTSALSILSGLFPNVRGVYDKKRVNANLFSFIIAPPASGKGALVGAKDLAQSIHNDLIEKSSEANILTIGPETNPGIKRIFLPGNISSAAIINLLRENNGIGIICESEADSMSNSLKQEWGSFSDVLRKAFHHEHISYARMKDHLSIEINSPKLSICLSGTPSQVPGLLKSAQDGLFSRFMFYTFHCIPKWKNVGPNDNSPIYDTYIGSLQDDIKIIYEHYKDCNYSFDMTLIQWQKFNENKAKRLNQIVTFNSNDTASIVFRMGLINYRIAMLLSILRNYENNGEGNNIECTDADYTISEVLCDVYLEHSLLVYKIMTRQLYPGLEGNITRFFNSLPYSPFQRKDAVLLGEKLGIKPRTVTKYLKRLRENEYLAQTEAQGFYLRASK